jgi:hypothetical protein
LEARPYHPRYEARRIAANIAKSCRSCCPRNYQRPSLARRGAFGGERLSVKLTGDTAENPMDQRIESFLADVLALAGENPDASAKGCGSLSPTARKSSGRRKRTSA